MKHLILAAVACSFAYNADAQRLRIHLGENGDKVVTRYKKYNDPETVISKETYANNLPKENIFYHDGGTKVKMKKNFKYHDNRLMEEVSYLYTEMYKKWTYEYDVRGNQTQSKRLKSQDMKTWELEAEFNNKYDFKHNLTYKRCVSKPTKTNWLRLVTYNYSTGKKNDVMKTFDDNMRIVGVEESTKFMGDEAQRGESPISQQIAVSKKRKDLYGNDVFETTVYGKGRIETYTDEQGRVVKDVFYGSPSYEEGEHKFDKPISFEYKYDRSGNLVKILSYDCYRKFHQRQIFEYAHDNKLIKETLYESKDEINWEFIASINHGEDTYIDMYSYTNLPSSQTNTYDEVAGYEETASNDPDRFEAFVNNTEEIDPLYYRPASSESSSSTNPDASSEVSSSSQPSQSYGSGSSNSLLEAISALESQQGTTSSEMYKKDMQKLKQLVLIMNSSSDEMISDEEVLSLALDLLIEQYRNDIKKMNEDHQKNQEAMFGY